MNTTPLFDTHAHLQLRHFDDDRTAVLHAAREAGVARILNLATRLESAHEVIALAEANPGFCLAAVGVHPSDVDDWSPETERTLMQLAVHPAVVVWGEIGLDTFHKPFDEKLQRRVFRRQLAIARELALPVSLHCRDAYDWLREDLETERADRIGGVSHCFGGTLDDARALIDMGLFLGVGGTSTYPKSGDLRDTLRAVGIAHLIVETDSPYLPPQPFRGRRNEPAYVAHTATALAATLQITDDELRQRCWQNARKAFRLNPNLDGRDTR